MDTLRASMRRLCVLVRNLSCLYGVVYYALALHTGVAATTIRLIIDRKPSATTS